MSLPMKCLYAGVYWTLSAGLAAAQVPDTDIWVADLAVGAGSVRFGAARNVTRRPGYDNQPGFLLDGRGFLFSSADSAGETDVFRWEAAGDRVVRVTATPESEYSPTPMDPPATGFCAVRVEADSTQRLWWFDDDGSHPRPVLSAVDSVGYFAWIDGTHVALFVLGNAERGQPHTLRVADTATQREAVVARDVGRAIHRVPGTRDVSFVLREADETFRFFVLRSEGGRPAPLIDAIGPGQDAAWVGETLLMASGATIYAATPRHSPDWHAVADFSGQGIVTVTRIAVSPARDRVAFVVAAEPR
jgi:hypothetical protein